MATAVLGAISQVERDRVKEGKRNFTPKQKKFLKLYAQNDFKEPKECAEKAGYQTHYWELLFSLKDDIKEIAQAILLGATPNAANILATTLTADKPLLNHQNKITAAKEILDRTGIVKQDKVEHDHKVSGGLFLMPMKASTDYIEGEVVDD